ncbi:hypothetical protein TIFTF001_056156, partial [Ficus carica]
STILLAILCFSSKINGTPQPARIRQRRDSDDLEQPPP